MSKQAAEHHQRAAEHHEHAARHHGEAAKPHEADDHLSRAYRTRTPATCRASRIRGGKVSHRAPRAQSKGSGALARGSEGKRRDHSDQ